MSESDAIGRPPAILQVDDCTAHSTFAESAIKRVRRDATVITIYDARQAVEHLQRCGGAIRLPDLVLLDRHMPGMDGYEALCEMRALPTLDVVSIVMVTGSDDPKHVARAEQLGADGYLIKPVDRNGYEAFVGRVLGWRRENSWRSFGGRAAGLELLAREAAIGSRQMAPVVAPSGFAESLPADGGLLVKFLDFISGTNREAERRARQSIDGVILAITEACAEHHIPVSHAMGKGNDQVTVANRNAVIMDLMGQGFSDRVVLEHFQLSPRHVERLRAEYRRKGGGLLAGPGN